jgi:hypothetical protein
VYHALSGKQTIVIARYSGTAGAPYIFAISKHELVWQEPREKERGKIDPSRRRREQKADG